jgi:hypothetical protein
MRKAKPTVAKLDKAFSEFIRKRDSNEDGYGKCITCGKTIHYKDGHCGHFISRRHRSTRWDEQNTALQCVACNSFNQGRQFEFGREIDKRYGSGTADRLLAKSRVTCKRGSFEIGVMTEHYKGLLSGK